MTHSARPTTQRLLLLEHNPAYQAALSGVLTAAGYQVATADEGWAGLAIARQQPPNLILCAATLPGLDGYALLLLCQQTVALRSVPFIILGEEAAWPAWRWAMEQGADDYLPRTCEASVLLRSVAARLLRTGGEPASTTASVSQEGELTLAALATSYPPRLVARRQSVYTEGDKSRYLYYVQAGRVKTIKTTSFGKELITSIYYAQDFLGSRTCWSRVRTRMPPWLSKIPCFIASRPLISGSSYAARVSVWK